MGAKKVSCFVPLLFFICFFINVHFSLGADSISIYRSLSGDETIVSSGGNFELGFFQPGNFSKYYIGIWFKKVSAQTVVWVANRERPITDKFSSELKVVDGNLVLFDEKNTEVWSTNTKLKSSSVIAVLSDEGNLVLRNGSSNTTVWQSWDYPSDTWLPGANLGYDKRANRTQILTSWKNSEDPAPGLYTYELDPIGNQYLIRWNKSQKIWTSGTWNGKIFINVPEMAIKILFTFTYISNSTGAYFTYLLLNSSSYITRFVMDYNGQIKQHSWLADEHKWSLIWSEPKTQCQVNAYCGAYGVCNDISSPFCNCLSGFRSRFEKSWNSRDYSGGCERDMKLDSGNANTTKRSEDIFHNYPYMKWPDNPQAFSAVNAAGCKFNCLSNISCTAYAYYENACFTWNGNLFNLQQLSEHDNNGRVIYIRLHSSKFTKISKGVLYGVVVGSVAVVLLFSGLLLYAIGGKRLGRATEFVKATEGAAITAKADVYSYGMMLFEFVSGRRNLEQTRDEKVTFFPASAANVIINGGDILTILDPNLNGVADVEEVTNICRVACWCIQDDEQVRPTMSQIVQILEGVLDVDIPPDPRGLQVFIDNEDDIVFFTERPSSPNLHIQSNPSWASSLVK
ncbi:Receptor-like serine/threonine-protein kinase [Heracleum sosnowskyi]|uniref:Receptor-like serine/threonine-protein kinase n=1 Tax=Heracleum sosnowskyi TaxID=360622 RepID=A0AAD8HTW5_9APIA|nr:Receptor-like serine/threonine-protein kinase [Heracleum sosnowskyi]